jgi:hypothetical protein
VYPLPAKPSIKTAPAKDICGGVQYQWTGELATSGVGTLYWNLDTDGCRTGATCNFTTASTSYTLTLALYTVESHTNGQNCFSAERSYAQHNVKYNNGQAGQTSICGCADATHHACSPNNLCLFSCELNLALVMEPWQSCAARCNQGCVAPQDILFSGVTVPVGTVFSATNGKGFWQLGYCMLPECYMTDGWVEPDIPDLVLCAFHP